MKKTFLNVFMIAGIAMATVGCKNDTTSEDAKEVATANAEAMEYAVDTSTSVIEWEGNKPTGTHTGTIQLKNGTFKANDSIIESGTFVISMTSINVTDLEGDEKNNLESHLKGTVEGKEGDFFNVNQFPEATFVVTGVNQVNGQTMLQGNLTMKEDTKNIEFPVTINQTEDAIELTSEPFTIDRTQWKVNYGSKSVFDGLGDKFINDDIILTLNLKAKKA
ncbi:MAG: YceI family protein [Bacteroidota bacterium]